MMIAIEGELTRRGIPFHRDGNRLRCFPHVVNIACQAFIEEVKKNPFGTYDEATSPHSWQVGTSESHGCTVRSIVSVCRASGQRRQDLRKVIAEGNSSGRWAGKLPDGGDKLPLYQLLRDCETRWSSTFLMIERLLLLYPAIQAFIIDREESELERCHLTKDELNVLRDIHQVLEIPHSAQEALSAERMPTLSMALPVYELLIQKWTVLASQTIPELSHHINVALQKLQNYVREARKTRIYALAMIVNPDMKFEWMQQYWEPQDVANARKWILEAMTKFRTAEREAGKKQHPALND
ncbi:ribonuclease H-like domain-containing protein, partial [Pisolithus albus]